MDQVESCATDDAIPINVDRNKVDVIIRSDDPEQIARALAGEWVAREDMADEIVVWAISESALQHGGVGYDRGIVSEQGERGEQLVFRICTAWQPLSAPGDRCTGRMTFRIEQ